MTKRTGLFAVVVGCLLLSAPMTVADESLEGQMAALAGNAAQNCMSSGADSWTPGAVSEPCLVRAFREHRGAFWVPETPTSGIVAIAVSPARQVHLVESIGSEAAPYPCVAPAIVIEFGRERLRCTERYVAPYRANVVPVRAAGRVSPPRPKWEIRVPAEICTSKASGNLSVEFVIDASGSVLMVDVLAVPRYCNMPRLETYLQSLKFEPGSLGGAPLMTSWFTIIAMR